MRADDLVRLRHLVEAAESALQFIAGRQRADLDTDRMLLFALVRALEIVGEAASRLSQELQAAHPELPWRAMIGMRHRLIHAYFDINTDIVWQTVTQDLPALLPRVRALLSDA
ncbi:MAG: DUF86 domain-containing protein [Candidatus Tectimicrobiota bacterium]